MQKSSAIDYLMEDPREAQRLETKVDPEAWVERYLSTVVRPGDDVLSVGCGPGVIMSAVTALHSSIHATGLDVSPARVKQAMERNRDNSRVKFVCGDAVAMPFPPDSFNVVYSRFLLEYLQEKEQAVAEMARVCRPGGTVLLQDLDGQLLWHYPEDAAMQRAVEKVVAALATTGFDPFVGRKLFWLAQNAGLMNVEVRVEGYHVVAGKIDARVLNQWELKLDIVKPQMAKALGGNVEAQREIERFLDYLKRPDTLTYSSVFTVTGVKP